MKYNDGLNEQYLLYGQLKTNKYKIIKILLCLLFQLITKNLLRMSYPRELNISKTNSQIRTNSPLQQSMISIQSPLKALPYATRGDVEEIPVNRTKISLNQIYQIEKRIQKILGFMDHQAKNNNSKDKKVYGYMKNTVTSQIKGNQKGAFNQNTNTKGSPSPNRGSPSSNRASRVSNRSKGQKQQNKYSMNNLLTSFVMGLTDKFEEDYPSKQKINNEKSITKNQDTTQKAKKGLIYKTNKEDTKHKIKEDTKQKLNNEDTKQKINYTDTLQKNKQNLDNELKLIKKNDEVELSKQWDNILEKKASTSSFNVIDDEMKKLHFKKSVSFVEYNSPAKKSEEEYIIMKPSDRKRIESLFSQGQKPNHNQKHQEIIIHVYESPKKYQPKYQIIEENQPDQKHSTLPNQIKISKNKIPLRTDEEFLINKYNYSKSRETEEGCKGQKEENGDKEESLKQKYKLLDQRLMKIKEHVEKNKQQNLNKVDEVELKQQFDQNYKETRMILKNYERYSPLNKLMTINSKLKEESKIKLLNNSSRLGQTGRMSGRSQRRNDRSQRRNDRSQRMNETARESLFYSKQQVKSYKQSKYDTIKIHQQYQNWL